MFLIKQFLDTKFGSYEQCLDFYIEHICDKLMTTDPDSILAVKEKMVDGITKYSIEYSKPYINFDSNSIMTRHQLRHDGWVCSNVPKELTMSQRTSGSTTGEPFEYYNYYKYFYQIQKLSEFDTILKEYNLYDKPLKILNLFKHPPNPTPEGFFVEKTNFSNHPFHCYSSKKTNTFFVNWKNYMDDPDSWHRELLEMLTEHRFDIVLGSGPVFNILCRYIKKYNFKSYFAYLISHTTEFPRINDFEFLKENGHISYYCDHMRCWDGGASFFTCKYGTYHLNDNLSWVTQGQNNKLISTDYINIVSPFINYWNGDLCTIENDYKLCDCGRYYRPFKMLENRPFALKGPTKLTEIKKQIGVLEYKNKINQVQFENLNVNIYLNETLNSDELTALKHILKDYKVNLYE